MYICRKQFRTQRIFYIYMKSFKCILFTNNLLPKLHLHILVLKNVYIDEQEINFYSIIIFVVS